MDILKTAILGLFFGTFGTTLGGIIGCIIKKDSNKFISFILSFSSGLMMAIICFDLIPESLNYSNIFNLIIGIFSGISVMILCDNIVKNKFSLNKKKKSVIKEKEIRKSELLRIGIVISIGLAIHNFPEGLAIGAGFGMSMKLGIELAFTICFHDIPEGISMAIPMKNGGIKSSKVIVYVILSGVTTGLGALAGAGLSIISKGTVSLLLSFATGAMLYITSAELTPEANSLYKGRMSSIGYMLGFIIGMVAMNLA